MKTSGFVPFSAIAALAVGLVAGFVLGGIAPRRELEQRDRAIASLERDLANADRGGWRSPVPGLDRILREPPPSAEERALEEPPPVVERGGAREQTRIDDRGDGGVGPTWRDRWSERAADERIDDFARLVSVQRVRRVQSRAALVEQADLEAEEIASVDQALAAMNEELRAHGEELLILAMSDEPPAARDLLGITHDVTGILHRAQARIEGIVGPERARSIDPSALEIWNHIDLEPLEPAARTAIEQARPR